VSEASLEGWPECLGVTRQPTSRSEAAFADIAEAGDRRHLADDHHIGAMADTVDPGLAPNRK